jgi:hypothetical protein
VRWRDIGRSERRGGRETTIKSIREVESEMERERGG